MTTTQDHIPIEQIRDDLVILKDGSMALVLQTSAVNFGLLSETEQLAIISSFAGLLNSLSFAIQIVIRSKKLDISSYLELLEKAQKQQTNPLLSKMMENYRAFIEQTVRENDVLDKKFYIIIPVSYLELGIKKDVEGHFNKALTILVPRRDHIIRQLWRVGLKANQLTTKQLIKLFYDIYNPPLGALIPQSEQPISPQSIQPLQQTNIQENITHPPVAPTTVPVQPPAPVNLPPQPVQPVSTLISANNQVISSASQPQNTTPPRTANYTAPFVVEEMVDEL